MRYLLAIYEDETRYINQPPDEFAATLGRYWDFGREGEGVIGAAAALKSTGTATSLRIRDGERLVTDGPFAETKEQLGGFYVVDVDDLDEALEWAARIPGAETGTIEIRPVMEYKNAASPQAAQAELRQELQPS